MLVHGIPTSALSRHVMARLSGLRVLALEMTGYGDSIPAGQVQARVVWGTADQFQELLHGERFARDLGTRVRRITGGRHFTPEDSPPCWPTASPTWSPKPGPAGSRVTVTPLALPAAG